MHIDFQFLQTGGVPLTANLMDEVKKSFGIYNSLGELAGNLTIIKGCEDISATEVAPGIVYVDGELLPFEGGTRSDTVFVLTQEILKAFKDASQKVLIIKKTVRFGNSVAPNLYNWSDFHRLKTLLQLNRDIAGIADDIILMKKTLAIFQQNGVCFPWRKPVEDIPPGFAPVWELAGRTVVGLDPADADFDTVGKLFGEKKHTLTVNEMPKHGHAYDRVTSGVMSGSGNSTNGSKVAFTAQAATGNAGGDLAHNNVQPSYAAPYIEWIG